MTGYHPRIGVVVAAYDLLPDDQKELGPEEYLRSNFPLFWQYIMAVDDQFEIRVSVPASQMAILTQIQISVIGFSTYHRQRLDMLKYGSRNGIQTSRDIGLPIIWAMGLDGIA